MLFCVCVQLISDAGYQGEITSVSTACQQLEVFSRVLRTSLATLLDGGEENLEKNLPEFAVRLNICVHFFESYFCYVTLRISLVEIWLYLFKHQILPH